MKRKGDNPRFSKQGGQQQPSTSSGPSGQQQPHRQCGGRGSGQNRKDKGKGKAKQTQGHSHVASVTVLDLPTTHMVTDTSLPSPTTHTVTHIGLLGVTTHTITESAPLENSLGFFPSVGKAVLLAEWMNVVPTIQTVKMLE